MSAILKLAAAAISFGILMGLILLPQLLPIFGIFLVVAFLAFHFLNEKYEIRKKRIEAETELREENQKLEKTRMVK